MMMTEKRKRVTKTQIAAVAMIAFAFGMALIDIWYKYNPAPFKVVTFESGGVRFEIWQDVEESDRMMMVRGNETIEFYMAISERHSAVGNSTVISHFLGWAPDPLSGGELMILAKEWAIDNGTLVWHLR